ncbi:uncharacterized protein LOC142225096 [Haematobia irritans]|uniref:uncharacterized protein LOC142225096 n=1 Tax=Haematobia irritans TaxID=7368 RepID=UPI003F501B90
MYYFSGDISVVIVCVIVISNQLPMTFVLFNETLTTGLPPYPQFQVPGHFFQYNREHNQWGHRDLDDGPLDGQMPVFGCRIDRFLAVQYPTAIQDYSLGSIKALCPNSRKAAISAENSVEVGTCKNHVHMSTVATLCETEILASKLLCYSCKGNDCYGDQPIEVIDCYRNEIEGSTKASRTSTTMDSTNTAKTTIKYSINSTTASTTTTGTIVANSTTTIGPSITTERTDRVTVPTESTTYGDITTFHVGNETTEEYIESTTIETIMERKEIRIRREVELNSDAYDCYILTYQTPKQTRFEMGCT